MPDIDPVVMQFEVPLVPAEAFELFTTEMGTWWPFTGHSCTDDEHAKVQFEPRAGGEVLETSADESKRFLWGTISKWSPPDGFSMSWHPGQPAQHATRLTVCFAKSADGCIVTLTHDGWAAKGETGALSRSMYSKGWVGVTELFVRHASEQGTRRSI